MANTTQRLVAEYNAARGLEYPTIGYLLWQNVRGDGASKPALYAICNARGGVTYSELNNRSSRKRCAALRAAIAKHKGV